MNNYSARPTNCLYSSAAGEIPQRAPSVAMPERMTMEQLEQAMRQAEQSRRALSVAINLISPLLSRPRIPLEQAMRQVSQALSQAINLTSPIALSPQRIPQLLPAPALPAPPRGFSPLRYQPSPQRERSHSSFSDPMEALTPPASSSMGFPPMIPSPQRPSYPSFSDPMAEPPVSSFRGFSPPRYQPPSP